MYLQGGRGDSLVNNFMYILVYMKQNVWECNNVEHSLDWSQSLKHFNFSLFNIHVDSIIMMALF